MSVLTTIWSLGAGACLALGLMHLVAWFRQGPQQRSVTHLWLTGAAVGAAAHAVFEMILLHSTSLEIWRWGSRSRTYATATVVLCLVWYLAVRLGRMRRWLAWTITDIWACCLVFNFFSVHSLRFREITDLTEVASSWGGTFTVAEGTANPWHVLANLTSFLFVGYVIDGSLRSFYRGQRDQRIRACLIGGSMVLLFLWAAVHTYLVNTETIAFPGVLSLVFCAMVGVLGFELSTHVVKEIPIEPAPPAQADETDQQDWQLLLDNVALSVVEVDQEGLVAYANPFILELLGVGLEDLQGHNWIGTCVPETERASLQETFERSFPSQCVYKLQTQEDKIVTLAWALVRMRDTDGSPTGHVAFGIDISEQQKSQRGVEMALAEITQIRDQLAEENSTLKQEIGNVQDRESEYRSSSHDLEGRVSEITQARDQLAEVNNQLKQAIEQAEEREKERLESYQTMEGRLTEFTELHDQLIAENETLKQEIEQASQREAEVAAAAEEEPSSTEETTPKEIPIEEIPSLADVQRHHIIDVLRSTGGKLEGSNGAAHILELKPSTLRNRMRKLGINRDDI